MDRTKRSSSSRTIAHHAEAEKLHDTPVAGPSPEVDQGPLGTARVAKGRCLHLPTGKQVYFKEAVQRVDQNGVVVGQNVAVMRGEVRIAGPGETVELPQKEIERLRGLGFLEPIDDKPRLLSKAERTALMAATGIVDDPRVAGR